MDFVPELKEYIARKGADFKAKFMDSVKRTWQSLTDFANAHRTGPQSLEQEVDQVISSMSQEEEDRLETGCEC